MIDNRYVGARMKFPLDWLFLNKWFWITILGASAIIIGPLVVISLIVSLPSPALRGVATVTLIFGWGIAAGFKDWVISKRREQKINSYEFQATD